MHAFFRCVVRDKMSNEWLVYRSTQDVNKILVSITVHYSTYLVFECYVALLLFRAVAVNEDCAYYIIVLVGIVL
jgi:hypothetical protein